MKVAFLDFDGTIVPMGKASLSDKAVAEAVKNLNSLLRREPDLSIVISSAWRAHGIGYCKRFLEGLGVDPSRVIGLTEEGNGERGLQIQAYLSLHPEIKHFVILDDWADMGHLKDHLVQCRSFVGLTAEQVDLAVEILKKP